MLELLLLGVGLAMDAAAVAAGAAIANPKAGWGPGLRMAGVFGAFQAGMPCIGWLGGSRLAGVAARYTPWLAFVILVVLGARMIRAAIRSDVEKESVERPDPFAARALLGLGLATSLDALAAGVTLPLFHIALAVCAVVIGVITFVIAAGAFHFGRSLGDRIGSRFEAMGGIALIGVAAKLLLAHLVG